MMEILSVVAVLVAGLMVGSELAITVFAHPALDRLPDDVHLPVASALARVLGKFMPFWYIFVILLTLSLAVTQWHESDRLPGLIAASAFLWLLSVVYSITASSNQQPNSIVAQWRPTCRLEDLADEMGPASPLARCAPHDSFDVSHRGSR
jgi:uncharacterized membrane protein